MNTDIAAFREQMSQAFLELISSLPKTWTREEKYYIQEEVKHFEYEDALENLIAIGLKRGKEIGLACFIKVKELASRMEIEGSPLFLELELMYNSE